MTDKYNVYQYYDELDLLADAMIEQEHQKPELKREDARCFTDFDALVAYCRAVYESDNRRRAEDFAAHVFSWN